LKKQGNAAKELIYTVSEVLPNSKPFVAVKDKATENHVGRKIDVKENFAEDHFGRKIAVKEIAIGIRCSQMIVIDYTHRYLGSATIGSCRHHFLCSVVSSFHH
jgi:hypothetical protein